MAAHAGFLANPAAGDHTQHMLSLKRRMNSATSGEWSDQEFDVFDGDVLVGRILRSQSASLGRPWLWTLTERSSGGADKEGYAKSLEAAMAELTSRWEATGSAGG